MAEYIEREALLKWALDSMGAQRDVVGKAYCAEFVRAIRQFKAADVAPVVRCKDCKNLCKVERFTWLAGECEITHNKVAADFFCAFGQRKDGDG